MYLGSCEAIVASNVETVRSGSRQYKDLQPKMVTFSVPCTYAVLSAPCTKPTQLSHLNAYAQIR